MPLNGELIEFEKQRRADLSAQSERDSTVLVEMVYRGKWVQFDISDMEAQFLTLAELADRYLVRGFAAVGIERAPQTEPSSS